MTQTTIPLPPQVERDEVRYQVWCFGSAQRWRLIEFAQDEASAKRKAEEYLARGYRALVVIVESRSSVLLDTATA